MRILTCFLIFNKIAGMLHFTNVMVITHDFSEKRISSDFFSSRFNHAPHHHRMMISAWGFDDHFFKKWMIQITELK